MLCSVARKAKRLINDNSLLEWKLQNLDHGRKLTWLAVFYWLQSERVHSYFLVLYSPCFRRSTRKSRTRHPNVVDIPSIRTKQFAFSFLLRVTKERNTLPTCVFPRKFNLGLLKISVNSRFVKVSSLNVVWDCGQASVEKRLLVYASCTVTF